MVSPANDTSRYRLDAVSIMMNISIPTAISPYVALNGSITIISHDTVCLGHLIVSVFGIP